MEFSTVDFAIIFNDRDTMTEENTDEATVEQWPVSWLWHTQNDCGRLKMTATDSK